MAGHRAPIHVSKRPHIPAFTSECACQMRTEAVHDSHRHHGTRGSQGSSSGNGSAQEMTPTEGFRIRVGADQPEHGECGAAGNVARHREGDRGTHPRVPTEESIVQEGRGPDERAWRGGEKLPEAETTRHGPPGKRRDRPDVARAHRVLVAGAPPSVRGRPSANVQV